MTKKHYFITFLLLFFCNNSFSQTQSEMNEEKLLLIQAEKDWVKFRDSHCKFVASQYEGGSIKPLIYSTCLEDLTRKRIAEIKASIKDRDR